MHDIDRTLTEFEPEMEEYFETDQSEFEEYEYGDSEGVFDEATEMEMASELLAVSDEAELDQFLGGLIKKAGRAIGRFGRARGAFLLLRRRRLFPSNWRKSRER